MDLLGNLLFNDQRGIPTEYVRHISSIWLSGLMIGDGVTIQMMHVRTKVQDRLKRGLIHDGEKVIVQYSQACP
ncbi:unnamed protein product [Rotaria sordida]|uniref:Uncharacterized protein n=1 Tax=Rotaria sordida TaxID=392033 RepID=A0A814TQX6_9BILA|nr:unnamed protein product [Rotaria sordida]CAF1047858.1 unnamed protein product [Rotaria sordida]CAF1151303.1 unnamed protein product [Rotaria sordida]CAF1164652.1 unnamed protein product [Rotaria sordida]CAF1167239.1 unnamed protein product [Rotaria sordida]